ncbi:MAG: carbohydrate porin [Thiobacillaceae bacterium]|jgi:hypothetical protein|nr:carbohydrate porin [Thiobacillaceae bacterium]
MARPIRPAPAASRPAAPLFLAIALLVGGPALASPDNEALLTELRRLGERVEQLEAANRRLESALLAAPAAAEKEKILTARLHDVELEVVSMRRQTRMIETVEGVSAGAALTMVAQRANGDATTSGEAESELNYRADISVTLPGGSLGDAEGRIFAHFRVGQGNGLEDLQPTLTGTPNSTAFQLTHGDDSTALLAQAWYQLDVPLDGDREEAASHVEINFGKIDPFVFFDQNAIADDESTRFLNNAFVHNPLLDSGGDVGVDEYGFTPGARVAYHNGRGSPDWWRVSLGLFGSGPGASFSDSLTKPFVIGQVEMGRQLSAGLGGNYRLYAWRNARATAYDGMTEERHAGWGLSVDQQVAEATTVFARYGQSTRGKVRFDRALTVGAELGGAHWGRARDRLGLALGWLDTSDGYREDDPDGHGPDGAERLAEVYYAWQVNEHLELSPDLQWISRPGGAKHARDMTIVGLRAKVGY